ncbi:MAG: hypothetical protein AAF921_02650 [Cyanobacteria bacterium P01_D01_bin.44]
MKTKSYSGNPRTGRSYRPSVVQWRADTVRLIVLGAALALIIYDAKVSYDGFQKLELGDTHAPLNLCCHDFCDPARGGATPCPGGRFPRCQSGQ